MPAYRFSGQLLRDAREAAGKSRLALADEVERSESAVTLWELDYRTPPLPILIGLAAALGVSVESFFETVTRVPA